MDTTQIDHHASYHSPLHPLRISGRKGQLICCRRRLDEDCAAVYLVLRSRVWPKTREGTFTVRRWEFKLRIF